MRGKAIKYNFKPEDIAWAQEVQKSRQITSDQVPRLLDIYQSTINPKYLISCSTCSEQIAAEFNRLVKIIEQSTGDSLRSWRQKPLGILNLPQVKEVIKDIEYSQPTTEEPVCIFEGLTKNEIRNYIEMQYDQDIGSVKGINREAVIKKANRVIEEE
jgi:hypothetical protein